MKNSSFKTEVIAAGIRSAVEKGLDKPHDQATSVQWALENAGFKIVRKPSKRESYSSSNRENRESRA